MSELSMFTTISKFEINIPFLRRLTKPWPMMEIRQSPFCQIYYNITHSFVEERYEILGTVYGLPSSEYGTLN